MRIVEAFFVSREDVGWGRKEGEGEGGRGGAERGGEGKQEGEGGGGGWGWVGGGLYRCPWRQLDQFNRQFVLRSSQNTCRRVSLGLVGLHTSGLPCRALSHPH